MKKQIISALFALLAMTCIVTGCGSSSEAEETTTEEIAEEVFEAEIEEVNEETEAELEEVEEEEEEVIEETETEAVDEDTMAALKEALDPDVHLVYDDLGGALLMPTSSITFDDTATEAINTLYELVYKETLGTYGDEAGIKIVGDTVKVMAGYYYREEISKEEYYEAIFDTEYYDTLQASLTDGTYVADENGTYYAVPGTETSTDTNTSTNNDNTGTNNTNTNNNNSGSNNNDTSTSNSGAGSGTNAAVEEYTEGTQNQSSGDMAAILGGNDGSQYGNETAGTQGVIIQ